jgi:hypothetical protein
VPVFSRVASKPCSKCMEGDFGAAVRPWSDWFAALAVPGRWERSWRPSSAPWYIGTGCARVPSSVLPASRGIPRRVGTARSPNGPDRGLWIPPSESCRSHTEDFSHVDLLDIERTHILVCRTHKVWWDYGSNLRSAAEHNDSDANAASLTGYQHVAPWFPSKARIDAYMGY